MLNGIGAVYDQMIRQGRGHVVNISSIDGNVRQIVYAIDQPWGVTIGDITGRATGEDYIL